MKRLSDRLVSEKYKGPDEGDHQPSPRDTRRGKPRKYIAHLRKLIRKAASKGIRQILLVLYARVSSDKQRRYGNINHQRTTLRRLVRKLGERSGIEVEIIDELWEDVSAWKLWKSGRPELVKATKLARENDAVLVALNTSRFVRNRHYWRNGALPTVDDFERLIDLVGNVGLATILPPEQYEDRRADTIQGKQAKDRSPGYKKRRRRRLRREVLELFQNDLGNREIGRRLDVAESTVRRWRVRYGW
jgi:DNA invertase Pin-like site-specific DNA recombinase